MDPNQPYIFDATTVDPASSAKPVPTGKYPVLIAKGEVKTNEGTGNKRLSFELIIQSGDMAGRKLYPGFNLWHKSAQTADIAQRELSALCHSVGVFKVNVDNGCPELWQQQLMVDVKEEIGGDGKTRSQVKGYLDMQGNPVAKGAAPAAAGQAAPVAQVAAPLAAPAPIAAPPALAAPAPAPAPVAPIAAPAPAPAAPTPPPPAAAPAPAPAPEAGVPPVAAPWSGQPAGTVPPAPVANWNA